MLKSTAMNDKLKKRGFPRSFCRKAAAISARLTMGSLKGGEKIHLYQDYIILKRNSLLMTEINCNLQ